MVSRTFGVESEPRENHEPRKPFWSEHRPARNGAAKVPANIPGSDFQKERAERLPALVQAALKDFAGAPCDHTPSVDRRDQQFRLAHAPSTDELDAGRMSDGLMLRSLSEEDPGIPERRGQIANTGDIRHILARDLRIKDLPPRGAVSAPARVDLDWYPKNGGPGRRFPQSGHAILGKYLKLSAFQEANRIGLTAKMAGEVQGYGKTQASDLMKELDDAGDAHRWLVHKAMPLIASGKLPRGRDTVPDSAATGFFRALIQYESRVETWLWEIGYKVKIDPHDLDAALKRLEPFEREGMEYLIQSRLLWMLYP